MAEEVSRPFLWLLVGLGSGGGAKIGCLSLAECD